MYDKIETDKTIAVRVTEQLREDIISKRIEAGSRITIKEISEHYGTSSMPVREAFRTLEGEKLLEINAYKGATVLQIDENFVRDVYGLLRALEALIYETAMPHMDEGLVSELTKINGQIRRLSSSREDKLRYIDLNTKFHDTIMTKGTNSKALELYKYHHMLIRTLRKSYIPREERIAAVAGEHQQLIDAMRSGNVCEMRRAVDCHVNAALENFLDQYLEQK